MTLQPSRSRLARFALAGTVVGALALPGAAAAGPPAHGAAGLPAQSPGIGGFSVKAQSSVVSVQLYEPTVPIPAEPQVELNLAYTRSTIATGPDGRGTASYLWPGDALGDGFGTVVGDPEQKWPSQVNARTPDGEEKQELTPGSGMRTTAKTGGVTAKVNLVGLETPGSGLPSLPGLPAAPPDAVPVSPGLELLASAEGITSSTAVTVKADAVTSTSHAAAKNIALLGGLITIDTVDTTSKATSTASSATADGLATVAGVTVAGKKLAIDSKGVHLADQGVDLPEVPAQLADQLKALGIEVTPLHATRKVSSGSGSLKADGLVITLDTKPLRSKLDTAPLQPIFDLLPQELQDQLNLILGLAPKIVYVIGEANTVAAASGPVDVPGIPGAGVPGGGAGVGGAPGAGSDPGGAAPGGSKPISRAGNQLPPLGAIPKALILGALALAAAVGWGLQRAGSLMLGGMGACEHGLVSGVPDLRKGRS